MMMVIMERCAQMEEEVKKPALERHWHQLYIDSQADPMDTRTDKDFCDEIALDVQTFRNWKSKYRTYIFKEVEKLRTTYRNEMRSKMYKSLTKKLDKDTNAIKLLAQLLGDLVEKTESKVEMQDADKVRRIMTLMKDIGSKKAAWDKANDQEGNMASPLPETQKDDFSKEEKGV